MDCETKILLRNDNVVFVKNVETGGVLTATATITWTLYTIDTDGTETPLATGAMSYAATDTGNEYAGVVESSDLTAVTDGTLGRLAYDATDGSANGGWDEPVVFRRRRFTDEGCDQ